MGQEIFDATTGLNTGNCWQKTLSFISILAVFVLAPDEAAVVIFKN